MVWVLLITFALMIVGVAFCLLAAVGVVRMPDPYMRVQATSKSTTLGATCVLLSAAVYFGDGGLTMRILLIIVFVAMTTPVAAHVISRAAYLTGVPLSPDTTRDELAGQYDAAHRLSGKTLPEDDDERSSPDA